MFIKLNKLIKIAVFLYLVQVSKEEQKIGKDIENGPENHDISNVNLISLLDSKYI